VVPRVRRARRGRGGLGRLRGQPDLAGRLGQARLPTRRHRAAPRTRESRDRTTAAAHPYRVGEAPDGTGDDRGPGALPTPPRRGTPAVRPSPRRTGATTPYATRPRAVPAPLRGTRPRAARRARRPTRRR